MTRTNIYADLPKAVELLDRDDAGEFGAATCPHCGAQGRYVQWFIAEDGERYGAMAGCFKKFPQHPVLAKIIAFEQRMKANAKKGYAVSRFDQKLQDAINQMRNKQMGADMLFETFIAVAWEREQYQRNRRRF